MENIIKEGTDTFKRLSPKNQIYFMTLLRLAEAAEEGVKCEMRDLLCNPPRKQLSDVDMNQQVLKE